MTDRELMQQALETLEELQGFCTDADDGLVEAVTIWTPEIIAALRERLAQPKRGPWQGLTDDEIHDCFQQRNRDKVVERRWIAEAIQKKLREKNT